MTELWVSFRPATTGQRDEPAYREISFHPDEITALRTANASPITGLRVIAVQQGQTLDQAVKEARR